MIDKGYEARKYLGELRHVDDLIRSNEAELKRLRTLSMAIGGSNFSERVKGGPVENRTSNLIANIIDLENDIKKEIGEYAKLRKKIMAAINLQENENERLLLKLRYINNMTWEEIAEEMDISIRWVYKLHKIALRNFKTQ